MKKIALLLCAALLIGMLPGCGSDDAYTPTGNALENAVVEGEETQEISYYDDEEQESFTLAYYADDGFNPYICEGYTNRLVFSLLYQGLFAVDREYNVEPMLCKSYTMSDDMMTYTFYLEAATFSDGSLLQASDVVASLKAAENSDIYGGRFTYISSIEATASDAVTITTGTAYENLPLLLDIPVVKADQVGISMPTGTGPYVLTTAAGGLTLQRRSNWWCRASLPVTVQTISLWAATDPVAIRDKFEFSDLGVAYTDPNASSHADYRCDYEVWDCDTGIFLYIACNTNSGVFSNQEVRAALTYAIDRDTLLEDCYKGFGHEATLPASSNSPYYDKGLAGQVDYDPDRFKQVIENKGFVGKTVVLLVNEEDTARVDMAKIIAQTLTDCGLTVDLQIVSAGDFRERIYVSNYDLYIGQTKLPANMDLSEFFQPYGSLSYGGMSDADCYDLCLEALENSGNYYDLYQTVLADGRLTPILFRTYGVYVKRGLLDDLSPARDNVFYYSLGKTMEDALIQEEEPPEEETQTTEE